MCFGVVIFLYPSFFYIYKYFYTIELENFLAQTSHIGISYLKNLPNLTDFLSQNLGYAQLIGKSTAQEKSFIEEKDPGPQQNS